MERRDLLKMIVAGTGFAMVGGNALAYQLKSPVALSDTQFNADDVMLFNEVAEVILPRTDTPGAKDANVGLMAMILANDCYTKTQRTAFSEGLKQVNSLSQKRFGKAFLLLDGKQKQALVQQMDEQAKAHNDKLKMFYVGSTPFDRDSKESDPVPHFFTLIKQLTIFCFFTSKEGATKVLRYEAIPGKYNGDLEYKKGDRAWAT